MERNAGGVTLKANHYEELGIPPTATADDIKRAYRQKATETHPDKGGDAARFAKVAHAYEVLKDPERKLLYDSTGNDNRTPLEIEVQNRLLYLFSEALVLPDDREIVATVRSGIKNVLLDISFAKKKAQADMKKLKAKRSKVKTTAAVNIFHMIIDQQLKGINAHLENLKHDTEIAKACLEALKTYSEGMPPQPVTQFSIYFERTNYER